MYTEGIFLRDMVLVVVVGIDRLAILCSESLLILAQGALFLAQGRALFLAVTGRGRPSLILAPHPPCIDLHKRSLHAYIALNIDSPGYCKLRRTLVRAVAPSHSIPLFLI